MTSGSEVEPEETLDRRRGNGHRIAVWLGWGKAFVVFAAALFFLMPGTGQDPAGRAMGEGIAAMALMYVLVFVAPALLLAYKGRLLGLAYALLLLPDAILVLFVATL